MKLYVLGPFKLRFSSSLPFFVHIKLLPFECNIVDGCRRNAEHQHQGRIIIFIQIKFYILSICTIRATVHAESLPLQTGNLFASEAPPLKTKLVVVWGALDETQHAHSKRTRIIVIQSDCEEFFFAIFVRFHENFSPEKSSNRQGACRRPREEKLFRTLVVVVARRLPSSWRKEITYTKIIIIILNQYYRHSKWKWIARNPHLISYFHFSFNMYSDSFTNFQKRAHVCEHWEWKK